MGEPVNYNKLPAPLKRKHLEDLVERLYAALGRGLRAGGYIGRSEKGEKAFGIHFAHDMVNAMLPTWKEVSHERNDIHKQFYEQLGEKEPVEDRTSQDSGSDLGI